MCFGYLINWNQLRQDWGVIIADSGEWEHDCVLAKLILILE